MKLWKRLCAVFLILLLPFSFAGCWNYREFDSLSMVSAIAIDSGKQGYKYHMTFEFLDASGENPGPKILETEGDTIFDAVRNAVGKSQKKLFFSACKTVVISQDLARQGIFPLFDFLMRDTEPRITTLPIISEEQTAAEILRCKPVSTQLTGLEIWKTLEQSENSLAESPVIPLYEAYNMLAGEGISLALPAIKIFSSQDGDITQLSGTAIFKKDILQGFLEPTETKFFLFVRNQVNGGLLLTAMNGTEKDISLEILGNHTSLSPVTKEKKVSMQISVQTKSDLGENQSGLDFSKSEGLSSVEKSAEQTLREGITAVIRKVQREYRSDIFGFGKELHESMPEYWKQVKGDWNTVFSTMDFTVNTKMNIQGTATAIGKGKEVE